MNNATTHLSKIAAVAALGAALGLAGCGPQQPPAPTAVGANGQPVPAYTNSNGAPVQTAPVYAQGQPQTAQVQPQYQQPQYQQPQQVAQQQPQYAPPPPQYAPAPQQQYSPPPQRAVASATLGEVEHIEPIRTRPQGSGLGAVVGGVLGGVVGNQFGHGTGKAGMTVLGAAGGAVAGNNIERNHKEGISGYRITVRTDNGTTHTYEESSTRGLNIGDRVSIAGGHLRRI